jgi:hypothetical protein
LKVYLGEILSSGGKVVSGWICLSEKFTSSKKLISEKLAIENFSCGKKINLGENFVRRKYCLLEEVREWKDLAR